LSRATELVICGVPFEDRRIDAILREVKDLGFTSVQIYTFWKNVEPQKRDVFDWSLYDAQAESLVRAGLKWVPFFIMGPRYAAPDWWLASPGHRGLRCLEHRTESPVESIWNPGFLPEIERVLAAFARHYLPMGAIESFQPGICGDYGEAIMPVWGNWPGNYHTHRGWWCAGEDARANLHAYLETRYASPAALNIAWRSGYRMFQEVEPFLPHRAPSRTAYFDQLAWYRDSMTRYAEFWMRTSRTLFPETPVYLCTGGGDEPEHASLFSAQARIAAAHGGGIRLTNEGNKFYDNFSLTAYSQSACAHYGAYMGLEPVGPVTTSGVVTRIFGSSAYGNRQMFHYFENLFQKNGKRKASAARARQYLHLIAERDARPQVAVFWPSLYAAYSGGIPETLNESLSFVRRMRQCAPVDESIIDDGGLSRFSVLVIGLECFTSRATLGAMVRWVENGGVVIAAGRLLDVELEPVAAFDELFGILPDSEQTWGNCQQSCLPCTAERTGENSLRFPRTIALKEFHAIRSWMGLHADTRYIARTLPGQGYSGTMIKEVSSAFYRIHGKGAAVLYSGDVRFQEDPEAIFPDSGVWKALLSDVLDSRACGTDLTPAGAEIARMEREGKIYALTIDKIRIRR